MTGPLHSLKILDFSTLLPGPCATMMLADMGAEVLRIESPTRLDMLRVMPPMIGKLSASHAYLNRGKQSLALDLKKAGAQAVILRLLETHNILVEQFRPGVMDRLGLGYEALRERFPRLIYCSITGYGQTGPLAQRAGHDINYLALAGVSSYGGRPQTGPAPQGVQLADVAGGSHHAVMAILAAVIERQTSGQGQFLDISMCDAALALNHMTMAGFLAGAPVPGPETELLNGATCYDYFATADGRYLAVGALEPQFVQGLCEMLDRKDLMSRMLSLKSEDRAFCREQLTGVFQAHPLAHWVERLASLDLCIEPVLNFDEVRQHPQFAAREMFCEVPLPDGQTQTQVTSALKFSRYPFKAPVAGGALGAETRKVLQQAGYTEVELTELVATGLFGKTL